ncbi:hypothetical protein F5X68DRAFT_215634 [Plectosphaerella plurivora]|uniref:Uncharacterized protein n=1 Tax=Plectosphaerella plurivora TaxID=936078 RepID=A0A9P8V3R7_9PEZI|nr:hypothetical protein F5X68DRAFT_215634 [Plectosphaerella plurivora]
MVPWNALIRIAWFFKPVIKQGYERMMQDPRVYSALHRTHERLQDIEQGRYTDRETRPGEATRDPSTPEHRAKRFTNHFFEEISNQWRGNPTKDDEPKGPKR